MSKALETINDLRKVISVNGNMEVSSIIPYADAAIDEHIIPLLGEDLQEGIEGMHDSLEPKDIKLFTLYRKTLAYLSFLKGLPFLEVNIGDHGITRTESEHTKTAYHGQIKRIENELKVNGFNALDRLLTYLDKEKETFESFIDSPAYIQHSKLFFKSSEQFCHFYKLKYGRVTYVSLLQGMNYVHEFNIKSEIGAAQFNDFIEKQNAVNLPPEYHTALNLLRNAIAYLSVAKSCLEGWLTYSEEGVHFPDTFPAVYPQRMNASDEQLSVKYSQLASTGKDYLDRLISLMNENLDSFPVFRDDEKIEKQNESFFRGGEAGGLWIS